MWQVQNLVNVLGEMCIHAFNDQSSPYGEGGREGGRERDRDRDRGSCKL